MLAEVSKKIENGRIHLTNIHTDDIYISDSERCKKFAVSENEVLLDFEDFNPFIHQIWFQEGLEKISLNMLFSEYVRSESVHSLKYFKDNILNSRLRDFNGQELFYFCFNHIALYEESSFKIAALLSVCFYRLSEDSLLREKYLKRLLHIKWEFDTKCDLYDSKSYRWYVSSSTPLIVCLLAEKKYDDAMIFLENIFKNTFLSFGSPLTFWNIAVCMQLYGLIIFYNGENSRAESVFLAGSNFCKAAIDILNSNYNGWVLSQFLDFRALLNLQQNFLVMAHKVGGKAESFSYFPTPKVSKIPRARIDFLLQRYPQILNIEKSFFKKVFYNLNRMD